jgi:nucleoside-diphosphate-sugar epimerase
MIGRLINDFSRRGLLDGRVCRLPTIIVRPGAPTAAASSFASGIVREPLRGKESVLPVDESLPMWVCSPKTVVKNLVYALSIPKEEFGLYRTVNLPGITVKVGDILEALEAVGGKEKRALVKREKDEKTEAIVLYVYMYTSVQPITDIVHSGWPAYFDVKKAKSLGFFDDQTLTETVEDFANSLR